MGADLLPGGEVSRLTRRGIRDKKWHSGFIKLAAKYRAPLLPAWINARNSALFYASTLVSDNLPLLLLMQQMFRRRNSSLPVRIGQQILVELVRCAVQRSRTYRPLLSAP